MTDFQHSTSDDIVEEPFIEPEGPVNEELLVRFGRHLQSLRRKRDFEELRNKVTCAQCGKDPDETMVTSCLHLYCSKCLKSLEYEAAEKDPYGTHCAACDDVIVESQSCQRLEELGIDAFLSLGGSPGNELGQRYIDLEAEEPRQQSPTITAVQQSFLVHAINKLMKLSYGEFFRQPVPADDARYPTYIGITIPINLKTMRDKLRASAYASIEMLKADFDRMVQNSRAWNGAAHQDTKDAQNLKVAFERYMAEYPEQDEKDVAPRKKAKKTRELKTISGHDPTRAAASSPPRAAKIAMQRQRYPRDHW